MAKCQYVRRTLQNFTTRYTCEGSDLRVKCFSEKVRDARASLGLSQPQVAQLTGVSVRSVLAYEKGEKIPRQGTMLKLAKALQVSVKFLMCDECDNPVEDMEKDGYIEQARERYGIQGAKDAEELLKENAALFAGGELSQEQKDAFFEAVMKAYITCKEAAREKFGRD